MKYTKRVLALCMQSKCDYISKKLCTTQVIPVGGVVTYADTDAFLNQMRQRNMLMEE